MDHYMTTRGWVKERSRPILTGLVVAAVLVAAVALFLMFKSRRERSAAEELALAFKTSSAMVANPIPPNAPGLAFTTRGREEQTRVRSV